MGIITAMGTSECRNLLNTHSSDAIKLNGLPPPVKKEEFQEISYFCRNEKIKQKERRLTLQNPKKPRKQHDKAGKTYEEPFEKGPVENQKLLTRKNQLYRI